ncbi:CD209 antigen-like protein C isoform X1 [Oreochromis niloticus]|uniref:CD209 antigen-like protein C n=1 Tax=Oreochromis niloticus TaxID=8128 RepID=A0A669AY53_ORENI|nr:CD209 antigen-like protein C isoform X1 [Oreochromis niloticus]
MDEVYVNTEEVLGCRRKSKREHQTAEDIYMNHEVIQTVQRKTTGPAPPGSEDVKKSYWRAAVILLGLLCLFLLIGLITVVFLFTQGKSQWEMETEIIHELYDNVTSERNQLQTSYNNLTTKQDQLQTSYNNLVKERDQLQKRLEDLTTNRDDLQRKLQYCQENWVAFSDSLYHVSSKQKSWEESRRDCLKKGSDLMIINSREEQNFVNQFKKHLWIGLTDSETEGTWKWLNGTQMTTSYWNSGEPNGGTNENCGQIKAYDSQNSWNDETCSVLHFWICEKRVSQ